jgi:hypothetical protein
VIFLPIVERELRVASRKAGTYWARATAALAAYGVALWTQQTFGSSVAPAQLGARVFEMLSQLGFFACLLPGVFLTADCLSREKREGTLGLLFLTRLTSLDVVLGKLAATSLNAFFGLLGILPVLTLPLLMGGVTAGDYWRVALVLTNTLWFSLATGLFVSAVSWHQQRALAAAAVCLVFAGVMLPLMGSPWLMLSPHTALRLAYDAAFRAQPVLFAQSLALVHASAWTLLLLANWLVLSSWRNPGPSSMESETAGRSLQMDHPALTTEENVELTRLYGGVHRAERPAMLDRNPIEWLASGRQRWIIWASTVLAVLFCLLGNAVSGGTWESSIVGVVALLALHGLLKGWVAWEASRRFTEERRLGMLELILVTPLSIQDILRGQLKSLRAQFEGPVLAVLGFDLLLLVTGVQVGRKASVEWVAAILFIMGMFMVDLMALAWMGMWRSLKTGKAWPSASWCLARVMGLPMVMCMGIIILLQLSSTSLNRAAGWPLLVATWAVAGLVVPVCYGLKARRELHRYIHQLASES